MDRVWKRVLNGLDERVSLVHLAAVPERPALLVFMFHVLFEDVDEMERHEVDPQQRITTEVFAQFVAYFLAHGYAFVTPADVLGGLEPARKYALITFDDGYYNNRRALPILRQYGVPATFFISTHHVLANQAFWWDVVYRARRRQPLAPAAQQAEYARLKQLRHPEIAQYLLDQFGPDALRPVGDLDRPFTPAELQDFARAPGVFLGNHTAHHAVLTNYSPVAAAAELTACQHDLAHLTGQVPCAVAYPNGDTSPAVVAAAAGAGLALGATVRAGKNYLPFARHGVDARLLNRFLLWGDRDVARQCALFRTDFHLKQLLRRQR
ncbi:polysaccharide deacetylase family protein [Hymenobacter caeli]|uniref:Peptidoglycan/xylan/chitin deacetylase (PgdA/CDA1 family) n=1 Tax=Hymenobacter caeli TaxID=2735894 RepID=A0ABX2FNL9_9BACT|nr:polysaccharide deacetylase family protein [Hymenobacter caeli]NRT18734.1 peptidoglycan/xylan/chitin deacetylase (PgdA/CDA1 family) [Hymenobacter caeli]